MSTVLVVASDEGFRRSLVFVLEAEGFGVDPHARLSMAMASPLAGMADCAVIDEDAVRGRLSEWRELGRFAKPTVLLMDRLRPLPDLADARVLIKPFLGHTLVEAVRNMLSDNAPAS
jgi:DNA-binding response OmpR family regulator